MNYMRGAAAMFAVFIAVPAAADGFRLVGQGGGDQVFVWRDKAAHDEGLNLISAGVHKSNPILVMRLLACVAPSGSRAVVTDMGFITHDIMVVDGKESGCRGNIPAESLKAIR